MPAPAEVIQLFERFRRNYYSYKAPQYNETQTRREFIDPMFEALGWDVNNKRGYAEAYKEVIHEDSVRVSGAPRSPDYSFRIGGTRKFFVETKKPSTNLKDDPSPAFQLRRYAWSAKLPVSILTDFEEFVVYDTRQKPNEGDSASVARIDYLRGDEILEHWDERIAGRFSREAVVLGEFDKFAGPSGKRRGTAEVDLAFLGQMEEWRFQLARILAARNPELSVEELNYAVQMTIDRIVFLRIAEDRGIEEQDQLLAIARKKDAYAALLGLFRLADSRYNSGLFHFKAEKGRAAPDGLTPSLQIDDKSLRTIIEGLYYPKSPYEFSVVPADILGQVYERFLGKVIRLTAGHHAVIEEKPEVRKAGGVYYTPTYIVRHIVERAIAAQIGSKTPRQIENFHVLDPACGSGSFLLEAYQRLLDWYETWYVADGAAKWARAKPPRLRPFGDDWRLTTTERKRILVSHIFGVDIDPQAVEVTKLSLLLKVLEGETHPSIEQLNLLHERALPDLDSNIKCGNSLIGTDFLLGSQYELIDGDAASKANAFDWEKEFSRIMETGGFDAVIGNPPYVLLQDEFRDDAQLAYFREQYEVAAYKVDTYHLFIERSLELTKQDGMTSMITPSNFLTNNHLVALRRLLLEKSKIEELIVVDGGVFEEATVDNAVFVLKAHRKTSRPFELLHAKPRLGTLQITSRESVSPKTALADKHTLFVGDAGKALTAVWRKIESQSVPLGSTADVNFGKQLRDRKRFTRDVIEVNGISDVPRGYRPCYTGKNVGRYSVQWNGLACLNKEEARSGGCWDPEKQDARNKLLTKQIGRFPEFGLDTAGHQCLNTMFMVNLRDGADPYVTLAQLNSRISQAVWLDRFYDRRRTFPKIKGTYLKQLPLFNFADKSERHAEAAKRIRELAKRAIALHQEASLAKQPTRAESIGRQIDPVERAIDAEFYELYRLTPDEIALLESIATSAQKP